MNSSLALVEGEPSLAGSAAEICARTLAHHSKSFALAGKLLPEGQRRDAAVLYTYCRLADDAIDLAPTEAQPAALGGLHRALDSVYRGEPQVDVRLAAFQELVQRQALPREYPNELLLGMAMDVNNARYETLESLLLYCHRVAGVVGLMMCHVLGVSDARALKNAAHLGIGMQLTNICRDVAEDWALGRLYLPLALLREAGGPGLDALSNSESRSLPLALKAPIVSVTRRLLAEADRFYRSGDAGIRFLPWRAAFSVRAARLIYSAIGARVRRPDHDVYAMRAVVPNAYKLLLLVKAAVYSVAEFPRRLAGAQARAPLSSVVRFPDDILPV